jgi:hypothetical protein
LRLTPEKVKQLADLVGRTLEANPEVEVKIKPEVLRATVATIINGDLKEEAEIEEAAHRKLDQHRDQIKRTGANYDEMLRKMIRKEAQERGFTL